MVSGGIRVRGKKLVGLIRRSRPPACCATVIVRLVGRESGTLCLLLKSRAVSSILLLDFDIQILFTRIAYTSLNNLLQSCQFSPPLLSPSSSAWLIFLRWSMRWFDQITNADSQRDLDGLLIGLDRRNDSRNLYRWRNGRGSRKRRLEISIPLRIAHHSKI